MIRIILYISLLFILNNCSINFRNLPKPNGIYSIGTDVFIFEDSSRLEWFTDNENDYRRIAVQIWYPSSNTSDSLFPYIDNKIKLDPIAEQLNIPKNIIKNIMNVRTNSYFQAPPVKKDFPLIIFSHGLGGTKIQNSINIEYLVSNGYIVASIDHSYDALITVLNNNIAEFKSDPGWNANIADFRSDPGWDDEVVEVTEQEFWDVRLPQINTRAKDVSFVINKLHELKEQKFYITNNCNFNKIGVFGHSFGGGTGIVASYLDNRISSCLNLDGWLEPVPEEIINNGLNIPFCYIGQIQENWGSANYNNEKLKEFHKNNNNLSYIFEVKDTKHMDYADIPYLNRLTKLFGLSGKAGKTLTLDLNKFILGFFDENLKNNPSNWIENINNNYTTYYINNK